MSLSLHFSLSSFGAMQWSRLYQSPNKQAGQSEIRNIWCRPTTQFLPGHFVSRLPTCCASSVYIQVPEWSVLLSEAGGPGLPSAYSILLHSGTAGKKSVFPVDLKMGCFFWRGPSLSFFVSYWNSQSVLGWLSHQSHPHQFSANKMHNSSQ